MVAPTEFHSVCLKFNRKIITHYKLKPMLHFQLPQPIWETQFFRPIYLYF